MTRSAWVVVALAVGCSATSTFLVVAERERTVAGPGPAEVLVGARQVESLHDIEQVVRGLGSGMTVEEFNRRINQVGERDPNPSRHAATFRYNFDNFQIIVEATISSSGGGGEGMRIERVHLMHDHLTIAQREKKRDEEWGRYVREHSGSR